MPKWRPRFAVRAIARIGDHRIRLYSVHLATAIEMLPVIIAGNTNAPGLWKVIDERGYRCVSRDLGGTRGPFSIDHIFARGLELHTPPARGVVADHDDVSDHRPVWAVLRR